MIPRATLTYLHDVDAELTVLARHRLQLGGLANPAGVLTELVTEDVGDICELVLPADRTCLFRRFPVKLRCPQKVGVSVTNVVQHGRSATKE